MNRFASLNIGTCAAVLVVAVSAAGLNPGRQETSQPHAESSARSEPQGPVAVSSPAALAERTFFDALNLHPERRDEALARLREAVRADPANGKLTLWLGLCHLWAVAEGDPSDSAAMDHAILAEHHLARAQRLLPDDDRIVSWLSPVRMRIAAAEGDADAARVAREQLDKAFAADPCFHAVAVGIVSFGEPRGSASFAAGLEALRRAATCAGDDPSIQNRERWPHNLEGFSLMLAQYELKAGNRQRAESMLMFAQSRPSYARWPGRDRGEDLLDRVKEALASYSNDDPLDDEPMVVGAGSAMACRICHQTAGE